LSTRRELLTAVALCLLGSALVLLAVSRTWVSYRMAAAAPLPSKSFEVIGTHLAPGARALALVGLAGTAAILATRGLGRAVVGVLVTAAGAGVMAVVIRALADPDPVAPGADLGAWPYVALLGALLIGTAGLLVVVRGRSWAAMSSRYDAPADRKAIGEGSLWEALDRGEDPTNVGSEGGG
jgi:uncharacterized membrane protein (TIGR02234 family)